MKLTKANQPGSRVFAAFVLFYVAIWLCAVWGLARLLIAPAHAATPVATATVTIPVASAQYRRALERESAAKFGLNAPVARLAAQIHQESAWSPTAQSPFAQGLAQFTPPTAQWLPDVCPEVGTPDPWDANWSIRAIVCYDHYLHRSVNGASDCDRWSFVLSAYNGGLGWVYADQKRASSVGLDSARWSDNVELTTSRASWARDENRTYVRRILRVLEPAYLAAGWSGAAACAP